MTKKKQIVAKPLRTLLKQLQVDGYTTWVENLFAYDRVAVNFPETADVVTQLEKLVQVPIESVSVECPKATCLIIDRLLYEHRILMEIRYAQYFKPVVTAVTLTGSRSRVCPPELGILSPNYESESYRKERRNRKQHLGPFVASLTSWKSEFRRSFSEQIELASEFCASRNLIHAARKAGSFEQLINQTVEKYLGYKFGVHRADT